MTRAIARDGGHVMGRSIHGWARKWTRVPSLHCEARRQGTAWNAPPEGAWRDTVSEFGVRFVGEGSRGKKVKVCTMRSASRWEDAEYLKVLASSISRRYS